jgi:hypothetical protein
MYAVGGPSQPTPVSVYPKTARSSRRETTVTYRQEIGRFLDAYYLLYDNANPVVQTGIIRDPES